MAKAQRKLSLEDNSRRAKVIIFFDVCSFFFDFSVVFFSLFRFRLVSVLPYIVYTDFGKLYLVFSVHSYRSIENPKISFTPSVSVNVRLDFPRTHLLAMSLSESLSVNDI